MPESSLDRLRPRGRAGDRVSEHVAALAEPAAAGVEVDGQLQVAVSTWFVYGHTSYDGEVVVGRYQDAGEAAEVLRTAPHRRPGHGGAVP